MKPIFTPEIGLQSQGKKDERLTFVEEISLWLDSDLSNDCDVRFSCFTYVTQ